MASIDEMLFKYAKGLEFVDRLFIKTGEITRFCYCPKSLSVPLRNVTNYTFVSNKDVWRTLRFDDIEDLWLHSTVSESHNLFAEVLLEAENKRQCVLFEIPVHTEIIMYDIHPSSASPYTDIFSFNNEVSNRMVTYGKLKIYMRKPESETMYSGQLGTYLDPPKWVPYGIEDLFSPVSEDIGELIERDANTLQYYSNRMEFIEPTGTVEFILPSNG